jgi:hypothetical protein
MWKGAWSKHDAARWASRAARDALGFGRDDVGVFWMALGDFLAYFAQLTVFARRGRPLGAPSPKPRSARAEAGASRSAASFRSTPSRVRSAGSRAASARASAS